MAGAARRTGSHRGRFSPLCLCCDQDSLSLPFPFQMPPQSKSISVGASAAGRTDTPGVTMRDGLDTLGFLGFVLPVSPASMRISCCRHTGCTLNLCLSMRLVHWDSPLRSSIPYITVCVEQTRGSATRLEEFYTYSSPNYSLRITSTLVGVAADSRIGVSKVREIPRRPVRSNINAWHARVSGFFLPSFLHLPPVLNCCKYHPLSLGLPLCSAVIPYRRWYWTITAQQNGDGR